MLNLDVILKEIGEIVGEDVSALQFAYRFTQDAYIKSAYSIDIEKCRPKIQDYGKSDLFKYTKVWRSKCVSWTRLTLVYCKL